MPANLVIRGSSARNALLNKDIAYLFSSYVKLTGNGSVVGLNFDILDERSGILKKNYTDSEDRIDWETDKDRFTPRTSGIFYLRVTCTRWCDRGASADYRVFIEEDRS